MLFFTMFLAFTTKPDCRHPAFRLERTVTFATVCLAGLEPADHLVGATIDPAFTCTTTVFGTATLASRGGDAACHGAQLLVSTAVFVAMWRSRVCVGGAAIKLARSIRSMLAAHTTCYCKSDAAFGLAHFRFATAMPGAPSFCCRCGSSRAFTERAEPKGTMFPAESTSDSS